MDVLNWRAARERLAVATDGVDVWRVPLDAPPDRIEELTQGLSEDERARALRFYQSKDRRRFIFARAALRQILATTLQVAPDALRFGYGPQGKPRLVDGALCFNLSHSDELALVAVARGREVGVDVERMRAARDAARLARRFFARNESDALMALPPAQRLAAFYRCWTRKEAYLKARGDGLSLPLDAFEVSLDPDAPAKLLAAPDGAGTWALCDVPAGPEYAAALAVEGAALQPRGWDFVW